MRRPAEERWVSANLPSSEFPLVLACDADGLLVAVGLGGPGDGDRAVRAHATRHRTAFTADLGETARRALERALDHFSEYLRGQRRALGLPLRPLGTDFQRRAWAELCQIPYGQTRSYGQQAAALGAPKSVRAIGQANGKNPLPLVIPCHRVIGGDGSLTGFGGGLARKRWLLDLERHHSEAPPLPLGPRAPA
ncbi:MAG: methylated-DNA--[protein]-cysteine S-methyltransferase [Nannocystis sp.]|nr:methylated-DNA--[protein]-cysteine S-methyltransferase [Nannocystis sp.]